ncbi:hypothetical protein [Streptomyces sp. NPDC001389]|uniref:hypothetical protein n=1 Tax=Streptomyces sp. NPDC001389 TaxID=3364569 RepID=UPI0036A5CFFB
MRIVVSSTRRLAIETFRSEQITELLGSTGAAERRTTRRARGEVLLEVRVLPYREPGTGEARWVVEYNDPDSREAEDTADRAEAERRYEELVREAADQLGVDRDGAPEAFDETDVAGVAGFSA